jgi:hypothetical protein
MLQASEEVFSSLRCRFKSVICCAPCESGHVANTCDVPQKWGFYIAGEMAMFQHAIAVMPPKTSVTLTLPGVIAMLLRAAKSPEDAQDHPAAAHSCPQQRTGIVYRGE